MQTAHRVHVRDSRSMKAVASASVELVVTSPPYPMIEMWDDGFSAGNPSIRNALKQADGLTAFNLMHAELDAVWQEVHRILKPGGFACINIGDAARTVGGTFRLYPNHARILTALLGLGFTPLPAVLWRKQTNAPNKFMGSGMLPAGAYVTLEHEYILIARKGGKREFENREEKARRRESAIFWEERNSWYSDVWMELKGTRQRLGGETTRTRSGAYPFELAYRLISMFSVKGDTVVDPFLGTGTTLRAAAAAGRNSIGYEIEAALQRNMFSDLSGLVRFANERIQARLDDHLSFVSQCRQTGREMKHLNKHYRFPVVTRQETELLMDLPEDIALQEPDGFRVSYSKDPCRILDPDRSFAKNHHPRNNGQLSLF
jgi:modification methylase